jgi:hypothetical protein
MKVLKLIYKEKIISYADLHNRDSSYIGALGKLLNLKLVDTGWIDNQTKCLTVLGIVDDIKTKAPEQTSLISYNQDGSVICSNCGASCIKDYGATFKNKDGQDVWVCTMCTNFDPGIYTVAKKLNLQISTPKEESPKKETKKEKSAFVPAHVWNVEDEVTKKPSLVPEPFAYSFFRCSKCEISFSYEPQSA